MKRTRHSSIDFDRFFNQMMHVKRLCDLLTVNFVYLYLKENINRRTLLNHDWVEIFEKHIRKYEIGSSRWMIFNGLDSKWMIFYVSMGEIYIRWV